MSGKVFDLKLTLQKRVIRQHLNMKTHARETRVTIRSPGLTHAPD